MNVMKIIKIVLREVGSVIYYRKILKERKKNIV